MYKLLIKSVHLNLGSLNFFIFVSTSKIIFANRNVVQLILRGERDKNKKILVFIF